MTDMQHYFSPTTGGWYNEAIHGMRYLAEPMSETKVKAGRKPRFAPNPECRIPADAIAVDAAEYARLLDEQGAGKRIVVQDGRVVAAIPVATADDQLAAIRSRRDRMLAATDVMLAVPDYPITERQREELVAWRAELRDFPDVVAPFLPIRDDVNWPVAPAWLADRVSA